MKHKYTSKPLKQRKNKIYSGGTAFKSIGNWWE